MDLLPGQALVARVWSWAPERLRDDAETQLREEQKLKVATPRPSVSVFAVEMEPGEELLDVMRRLCGHVQRKAKWVCFTTWDELGAAGFDHARSEPPQHHYDVYLSNLEDEEEVKRLAAVFNGHDKRKFPSCDLPT
ncbi:hypothetical protein [Clavibacter nebraskensis]|uniref:hypothetical protein n=1 Tax=Clavibacter nebraskensis TaxID=31963 RepID=UPI00200C8B7A|nr:hypothetical protein [Clavibacter nebraskensis]UQB14598.1 hypothetical protein LIX20_001220 [Clavibacter nebraskensis]UQB17430.1 hypothetical protein LIX22_001219 [Clavibacter nebraskensis]